MNRNLPLTFLVLMFACSAKEESSSASSDVAIIGAMRNVMMNGQLQGTIDLDTIATSRSLYGLGPEEYLRSELLIYEGITYRSYLQLDSIMVVEASEKVKAPFFAYSYVEQWESIPLPDSVSKLKTLERYLTQLTSKIDDPFLFQINGTIKQAGIHVVNLPNGAEVHSPQDAHLGQRDFKLSSAEVSMVGFFSEHHQSIFTHHDTNLHIHLIDKERKQMGHLDDIEFNASDVQLEVPAAIASQLTYKHINN